MKVAAVSRFRKNIKSYIDDIDKDQEPLILTRSDDVSVVVVPLNMYNSYAETAYLLSSPANAKRLKRSMNKALRGEVEDHKLVEV